MSSSNNDHWIIYKALPIAVLALAGAYFVMTTQKSIYSKPKSTNNEKSNAKSISKDKNFVPQFLRDPDTGEYFVVENEGQEPRLISIEEMYELTGSRPVEEEPKQVVPDTVENLVAAVEEEVPVVVELAVETVPAEAVAAPVQTRPEVEHQLNVEEEQQQELVEEQPVEPQQQQEQQEPEAPLVAPQERVIGIEDFEDFQDEGADIELEQANQQLPQNMIPVPGQAGPGPNTANNRVVGTKKTKSLEKKKQRRAYFEHQRMEAMINKQEEEEYERKYGALIEAERSLRREAEEEAEREKREAAQKQKEEEERIAAEKERIRQQVNALKPGESLPLNTELEREVAKSLVSNSNFLIDEGRLLVNLSEEDLGQLADIIKEKGFLSYEELAESLTALKN